MHVPCRSELGIEARVSDNHITVDKENRGLAHRVTKLLASPLCTLHSLRWYDSSHPLNLITA